MTPRTARKSSLRIACALSRSCKSSIPIYSRILSKKKTKDPTLTRCTSHASVSDKMDMGDGNCQTNEENKNK